MTAAAVDTQSSTTDYALCTHEGCGVPLPTPQDAREHGKATMTPTSPEERAASGITARGHSYRVLNERLTYEEVTQALRDYPDFADGWAEWHANEEADRG